MVPARQLGSQMNKNAEKPRTRIQQKNRDLILSAGLEVFSSYGFRGSTLDQIAEAAGLSKPNLLYYFASKEAIHAELLNGLMDSWLDPMRAIDPQGDPTEEILAYMHRKLELSRDFPRESRLFANEILQGAPRIRHALCGELKELVDQTAGIIDSWAARGAIAPLDAHHLIFSIWSLTQHYADFDVQVQAVLGREVPYKEAGAFLETLYRKTLSI